MAVSFDNLNSAPGLKKFDEYLLPRSYITRCQASKDDIYVYAKLSGPPSLDYVHVSRWYKHIETLLSGIYGEGQGVKVERSTSVLEEAPVSVATDDDDDVSGHPLCLDTERLLGKNRNFLALISKYDDNKKNPKLVHFMIEFLSIDDHIQQALQKYFEIIPNIMEVCKLARIDEFKNLQKSSHLQIKKLLKDFDSVGHRQVSILEKLGETELYLTMNLNLEQTSFLTWRKTWSKKFCIAFILTYSFILTILSIFDSQAWLHIVLAVSVIFVSIGMLIDINSNISKQKNERENMLISGLKELTSARITYLKDIKAVVDKLKDQISPFKFHNKVAVITEIKKIRKTMKSFQKLQSSFGDISRKTKEIKEDNPPLV